VLGPHIAEHVEASQIGAVVDTTGAGDDFNGAFAVCLAEGMSIIDATRFGCAAAGLSVTRPAPRLRCRSAKKWNVTIEVWTWRPPAMDPA
jgi:sugar/nucleoside kinase (ribokinase family)